MAHISEYKRKDGTTRYRAHVHRSGQTLTQRGFPDKKAAKRWADEQDRSILLTGLPATNQEMNKHLLSEAIEYYRDEIGPTKGSYVTIKATLDKFLGYDICKLPLGAVKPKDVYEYIAIRKKEKWHGKPIKNATIRRDLTPISRAFDVAKKHWGFDSHINPFAKLDRDALPGANNRRKRRLKEGELQRLEQACEHCLGLNRLYVPLAIYLAIDTGMRLQEIFNLTWQDVDLEKRLIEIRKSKTDHLSEYAGRTIVLPVIALFRLARLSAQLRKLRRFKSGARIFPMTKGAFKQSWADVRTRAGIEDLAFHDLRHEAASRFDEADLSTPQRNLMMGHYDPSIGGGYVHSELKRIQDKLDMHLMGRKLSDGYDEEQSIAQLAELVEGKHGIELQKLIAQDLKNLMPGLREKVLQFLAKRDQAANVVPFAKPLVS